MKFRPRNHVFTLTIGREKMRLISMQLGVSAILVTFAGCGDHTTAPPTGKASTSADGGKYLLAAKPAGAKGVIDARKAAKDNDEVVVVGRIGGSTDPWIKGKPAFSLVDSSLKACSDVEGDPCQTPWDYCCVTDQLPKAMVLVKVVDADDKMPAGDARELLKVKELQTVTVKGKAKRDDAGNIMILAKGIFVEK